MFLAFTWHKNIRKIHEGFLSLDAMTVAVWFNLAGSTHSDSGASTTLILALYFVAGMVVTDSINGLLVSKWADGRELMTGALVLGMILVGYLLARRINRASLSMLGKDCHFFM